MPKFGKRYRADLEKRSENVFPIEEAVKELKKYNKTKFDQTVEVVMHLGIDPRQADQQIRGAISLPNGIGATKRVIAFCSMDKVEEAKAAGAVEAGAEELVKKIEGGWFEFDVAVAEPAMMRVIAKLGRTLGPKGLMPSPKAGTVNPKVADTVKEFAAGKVEYRNDDGGNIHGIVGKFSFDDDKLTENAAAFIKHIEKLKPASTKGHYIKKIAIAATMTPSVLVAE
ncbi:50S ribosomal protein L1 [Planctomycetota bacterium]|nr:50S ribosomal protein L1 [Planctomycetota bacterium]